MTDEQLKREITELERLIQIERGKVRAYKDTVEALKQRGGDRLEHGVSHIIVT